MSSHYDAIMESKPFLPYRMGYLTDWMNTKAEEELNETEQNRNLSLKELRNLIAKDTELKCWKDDATLLQFLRASKFNVDKAWGRLRNLFVVKKNYPEVYPENPDMDTFRKFFETGATGCLPYRDENGVVVVVFKIAKWDPDAFTCALVMSALDAVLLSAVEYPATQVCGVRILIDMQGASIKQMSQFTPRYLKLISHALRNTLPVRYKGIHCFNESIFIGYAYSIIKIFLSEKMKKRIHFHGSDAAHLQKYIPKEILPVEYGGDNIHFDAKEWCQKEMEPFLEKFEEMHHLGYC